MNQPTALDLTVTALSELLRTIQAECDIAQTMLGGIQAIAQGKPTETVADPRTGGEPAWFGDERPAERTPDLPRPGLDVFARARQRVPVMNGASDDRSEPAF